MKHAIKYLTVILAIVTVNVAVAQKAAQKRADKLYGKNLYKEASVLYEHVVKKDPNNSAAFISLGNSYRKLGMPVKAEDAYSKAAALGTLSPDVSFYYATVLAANGKIDEARKYYAVYSPDMAKGYDAKALYNNKDLWKVQYAASLNTWGSEMGPVFYKKKGVVYSSARISRCAFRRVDRTINGPFYDLYFVGDTNNIKVGDQQYVKTVNKKGKKMAKFRPNSDDTYNTSNDSRTVGYIGSPFLYDSLVVDKSTKKVNKKMKGINKRFNDGPVVFYESGDSLIFTRTANKKSKSTKRHMLELYSGKFDGTKVSDVKALALNSKDYSVGYPALSPDGKTLYFASDMPGGRGGFDLYSAKWENGAWSTPVNLGDNFNSPGNDIYPFVNGDGQLFFSSDGWAGMGGMDIYMAWPEGTGFSPVENLGVPVNTEFDDFSYTSDKENKTGYFASNRRRGGVDDDIYKFNHIVAIKLEILVLDDSTLVPINLAQVTVSPLPTGQEATKSTKEDGLVTNYWLEKEKKYTASISREGYDPRTLDVSTEKIRPGSVIKDTVKLGKVKFIVDGFVSASASENKPVENATIYIRSKTTGATTTLTSDAAGNFNSRLAPESDYIIWGEKMGTYTDTITVSTMGKKLSETYKIQLHFNQKPVMGTVYFDFNKYDVRKELDFKAQTNDNQLSYVASLMLADPNLNVIAKSYADWRGTDEYNDSLTHKRSTSAKKALIATIKYQYEHPAADNNNKKAKKKTMPAKEFKALDKRIAIEFYGEKNITNGCVESTECTEEKHQENRRTDFVRSDGTEIKTENK